MYGGDADESIQYVVEKFGVGAGDDVPDVQALGLQDGIALVDCARKGWDFQQVPAHARPLTAHSGEYEPNRPFGARVVLIVAQLHLARLPWVQHRKASVQVSGDLFLVDAVEQRAVLAIQCPVFKLKSGIFYLVASF